MASAADEQRKLDHLHERLAASREKAARIQAELDRGLLELASAVGENEAEGKRVRGLRADLVLERDVIAGIESLIPRQRRALELARQGEHELAVAEDLARGMALLPDLAQAGVEIDAALIEVARTVQHVHVVAASVAALVQRGLRADANVMRMPDLEDAICGRLCQLGVFNENMLPGRYRGHLHPMRAVFSPAELLRDLVVKVRQVAPRAARADVEKERMAS